MTYPTFFLGLKYGNFGPSFPKRSFVQAIAPPLPHLTCTNFRPVSNTRYTYIYTYLEWVFGAHEAGQGEPALHWDLYLPKWGLFSGHFLSLIWQSLIERSFKMFLVMGKSKWPIAKKNSPLNFFCIGMHHN